MSKIRIVIEYDITTKNLDVKAPMDKAAYVVYLLEVVKSVVTGQTTGQRQIVVPNLPPTPM
jgi:hypothetical protein